MKEGYIIIMASRGVMPDLTRFVQLVVFVMLFRRIFDTKNNLQSTAIFYRKVASSVKSAGDAFFLFKYKGFNAYRGLFF
jgi:hypothetical protein